MSFPGAAYGIEKANTATVIADAAAISAQTMDAISPVKVYPSPPVLSAFVC